MDWDHMPDLLYPSEVAKIFRVDPKTVHRWARAGRLGRVVLTPGGHHRYPRDEVKKAYYEMMERRGQ